MAVLQSANGQPAVHWNNSVLYPGLGDDQSLTAGKLPADASSAEVVASDGKTDLTTFPSLRDMAATIRKNVKPSGGSTGTGVAVVDSGGDGVKRLRSSPWARPRRSRRPSTRTSKPWPRAR
ncbi:hypothetical protein [Streptomyces lomondensis]|uniref:Uncharacterized protein n=1 Tax=Streptomyces lomondensis TaxID=68229 RepID=A0ABQ2XX17_9ACTN|nr:hypothetical protein [Streptomyces lomondensis]MCF0076384.1 hypothetical protein [Streptomyces lomondensis]GGX35650.1 hypothetical protein GCM10010383_77330 [Streptomyces lomondensis]